MQDTIERFDDLIELAQILETEAALDLLHVEIANLGFIGQLLLAHATAEPGIAYPIRPLLAAVFTDVNPVFGVGDAFASRHSRP